MGPRLTTTQLTIDCIERRQQTETMRRMTWLQRTGIYCSFFDRNSHCEEHQQLQKMNMLLQVRVLIMSARM